MIRVLQGDCLAVLPKLAADGVRFHSVVTDPPYHLTNNVGTRSPYPGQYTPIGRPREPRGGFMGKQWDGGDVAFRPETWRAVYDVMLPGAYLVAFASTRGYHRMVCAIEDAGFVIHPMLAWIFGSGFPKAQDASKAIDRQLGATREVVGLKDDPRYLSPRRNSPNHMDRERGVEGGHGEDSAAAQITAPATPEAAAWAGWKYGLQSLKPAIEPICLAQRPMEGTGAANLLRHGCGALNVDASRVPSGPDHAAKCASVVGLDSNRDGACYGEWTRERADSYSPAGRYPSNVILDGSPEVLDAFATFGESKSTANIRHNGPDNGNVPFTSAPDGERLSYGHADTGTAARFFYSAKADEPRGRRPGGFGDVGAERGDPVPNGPMYDDGGTPSRFFYSAKADKGDRADSKHPTVKPIDLIRYLVRLVTPPGGRVLDPFAGSGTTGEACMLLGHDCTMIERDATHAADIRHRIRRWSGLDAPLFAEAAN